MEALTTEQEQIEELRKWWAQNGTKVLVAVVVGLAALFGTRYWMYQQDQQRIAGSALYEAVARALEANEVATVMDKAALVISQHPDTPYAALSALAIAKVKYEQGDKASAQTYLRWVLEHSDDPAMQHVARLRLARVLADDGKANEALQLIEPVTPGSFAAAYDELKGDLYVALNRVDDARRAYGQALASKEQVADRATLQMKLDDLGAAASAP